ncbi:MAG: hypothetical protein NUW07_02570 [Candidatus Saccharicenans sp.]|jgi:hypothetical protein|nr:hypothetical protein [Candidatus Saccharicenans sp.]MDH7492908.1 hypothetical protein [Candidatus Saccharicenans sp.]
MADSLAELFRLHSQPDDFFEAVRPLGGQFPLGAKEMVALGQAYFERYPEKFVQRDLEEVRLGYRLTRFCLLEKALGNFPEEVKEFFRRAFEQPEAAAGLLESFRGSSQGEKIQEYFGQLQSSLSEIKSIVDELPKGMIKERFLGGLSTLFNISYLLKILISRTD